MLFSSLRKSTQVREAERKAALLYWAKLEFEEEAPTILGIPYPRQFLRAVQVALCLNNGKSYAHLAPEIAKVGFPEGIASFLQHQTATNNQARSKTEGSETTLNDIIEAEISDEAVTTIVTNYTSMLQNFGVIAALIVSVLFPIQFANPSDISQQSVDFFGAGFTLFCFYVYLFLLNICLCLSCLIIIQSIFEFKQLNFWMVSKRSQLQWARSHNLVLIVLTGEAMLLALVLIIPLGSVALSSPIAALASSVVVIIAMIFFIDIIRKEEDALRIMYEDVRMLLLPEDAGVADKDEGGI